MATNNYVPPGDIDRSPGNVNPYVDPGIPSPPFQPDRPDIFAPGNVLPPEEPIQSQIAQNLEQVVIDAETANTNIIPNQPVYLQVSENGNIVVARTTLLNFTGLVNVTGDSSAATVTIGAAGNWAFLDDTIYNLNGGVIENGDLSHGATSTIVIPPNGSGNPLSLLNYYGNITLTPSLNPGSTYTWTFDRTGNLVMPSNAASINYANGQPYGSGGTGNGVPGGPSNSVQFNSGGTAFGGTANLVVNGTGLSAVGNVDAASVNTTGAGGDIEMSGGNITGVNSVFLGNNVFLGTVADGDSVLWAPYTSEYISLQHGGNIFTGSNLSNVGVFVGKMSEDEGPNSTPIITDTNLVQIMIREQSNLVANSWFFFANAAMQFPDGTQQTTAYTGGGGGGNVTYDTVTLSNIVFDGTGPVIIESGNDLNLSAVGQITINDWTVDDTGNLTSSGSISTTGYIAGNLVAPNGNGAVLINASGVIGSDAGFSYDTANNMLFSSGITASGNATTGVNAIYAGIGGYTVLGSEVLVQITSNANSYSQINQQNVNNGTLASGDYIITADNGTDSTYYLDIGLAGSNHADPDFFGDTSTNNDAYIYVTASDQAGPSSTSGPGNLIIGSTNGVIKMFVGNTAQANVIATVDSSGLNMAAPVIGDGNLYLQPDPGNAGSYLDIYLTTGPDIHIAKNDSNVILGSDTGANVTVGVNGAVSIQANTGTAHTWTFATNGTTIFPTLSTARGDNPSGNITGTTINIGDGSQEAIITTPDGNVVTQDSQRIVINPGKGADLTAGEGGDIYLWAGRGGSGDNANAVSGGSGGDIKIRGGQGGGVDGAGGYIRIEAGDGASTGTPAGAAGYVEITGGTGGNAQAGGYVSILAGQGDSFGGDANLIAGVGVAGPGGAVNITGGTSGNGLAEYGNVNITAGASTWTFDNTGTLRAGPLSITSQYGLGTTGTILEQDGTLELVGNGTGCVVVGWNSSYVTLGNVAQMYFNPAGSSGNILVTTGNTAATSYEWNFDKTGNFTAPGNVVAKTFVSAPVAFANLTAVAGARAFINDGNLVAAGGGSFGAQVSGGGSNICPVWSDGSNWYVG